MNWMTSLLAAASVASLAAMAEPARAEPYRGEPYRGEIEWYDCYIPNNHWRHGGGVWRWANNDPSFVPRRDLRRGLPEPACGSFLYYGESPTGGPPVIRRLQRPAITRNDHIRACSARYRTYDARSDTYVGQGGRRRFCRL